MTVWLHASTWKFVSAIRCFGGIRNNWCSQVVLYLVPLVHVSIECKKISDLNRFNINFVKHLKFLKYSISLSWKRRLFKGWEEGFLWSPNRLRSGNITNKQWKQNNVAYISAIGSEETLKKKNIYIAFYISFYRKTSFYQIQFSLDLKGWFLTMMEFHAVRNCSWSFDNWYQYCRVLSSSFQYWSYCFPRIRSDCHLITRQFNADPVI